ncbi:MAG TPA: aspartate--ammonia ligase [Eubacteriales bacterium]|nr:aspartate--ammonia ligase [Eubacteriales bacterium]HRU84784.1 aspartate--ammonia ligase [Eubacteriales bacterium]
MALILKEGYKPKLNLRETQRAIKLIKDEFQRNLVSAFGFERVSAPLMVFSDTGINDDLNGVERKVEFDLLNYPDRRAEIVQSLAKWKRQTLRRYEFSAGEGLYTDMNAIRRDDLMDNTHSIYVDQWDWEMVITREQRSKAFLRRVVSKLVDCVCDTLQTLKKAYPVVDTSLSRQVFFITSEELLKRYPNLTPKERENAITKEYGTVFIEEIGVTLSDGTRHDGRAPDYDDWTLNGDIFFYHAPLDIALEISSMGIRVDGEAMVRQLAAASASDRLKYSFHRDIVNGDTPLTIGGGIGQSRLCMLMLQKLHIGEVNVSLWSDEEREDCKKAGIRLL